MGIKRNWWKSLLYSLVASNIVYAVVYILYQYLGYELAVKFWHGLLVANVVAFLWWLFQAIEW